MASTPKRKRRAARSEAASVSVEELHKLFRDMLLIRRFEEKAGQLYGMELIGGFCHLYIGQEAVVVGLQAALIEGDSVITSYRDHGQMLACGMDPSRVMAELTGRQDGYSSGKGGSMHIFSREAGFYGGHGVVGAQVPIGAGIAFAHKYRGDGGLCVTYYGDGAVNNGQVWESLNLASLWKLPVIFVIENNKYGMGTAQERASAVRDFSKTGQPFGVPGKRVDGMDVIAVKEAAEIATAHVRAGKGPYLLEMETYRYRGHSMSDPAKYRSKEEVSRMRSERDPINGARARLLELGVEEDALKELDKEIKGIVTEATEFAQASPEPDPSELHADVLIEA